MPSKFQNLLDKLDVSEKFNKRIQKDKTFNKVKDNVPLVEDSNMMADVLHLPETSKGFKYLFVIVDLATDEFDIEPMKVLDSKSALVAMKACFRRNFVKMPKFSLKTDGGSEFKDAFDKYLYDNSILHKKIIADRHQSMSNVESLNKQLGRLFNGYMNTKEEQTGKVFKEWTNAVGVIRTDLNEIRKKKLPGNINSYEYALPVDYRTIETEKTTTDKKTGKTKTEVIKKNVKIEPKFKVGDNVFRALEKPRNALGKVQPTKNFRTGDYTFDTTAREIKAVYTMGGKGPLYRYALEGLPNASFTERQLMKAPDLYF